MGGREEDSEAIYNFAFEQFERYRQYNPEIAKAVDEFCGRSGRNESAPVMYPLFNALRSMTNDGVSIPRISEASAQKSKDELSGADGSILDKQPLDEFRGVTANFVFFLGILVKDGETAGRAKVLFATILRMIQVERASVRQAR